MHKQNPSVTKNWLTKLALFVGIAGVSTLISFPALAKFYRSYALFQPTAYSYPYRTSENNIASALNQDTKYANLARQLKEAGLLDSLKQPGNFTIFAPTNQAFDALPKDVFNKLSQPNNRLKVLKYHLVSRLITEQDIKSGSITTTEGTPIKISVDSEETVKINNAIGQHPSTVTKNGVIIEIDKVLLPAGF